MKKLILAAALLATVGGAAFGFDYQSNVGSFVASAVSTSDFDQFTWYWVGYNDQKIAVTSDIAVTRGGFRIVRQRDGAVMYEASEGTNSINAVSTATNDSGYAYLSLTLPRTNLPPNGTYLASFLAYEVTYTTVPTRVLADGKIVLKYSPWQETNETSYINPLAYTIIGPPGHTLTDSTNWPFALSASTIDVARVAALELGQTNLTSTQALLTTFADNLSVTSGTHTTQIGNLATTGGAHEIWLGLLTATQAAHTVLDTALVSTSSQLTAWLTTVSNAANQAQDYADTNLASIGVLNTGMVPLVTHLAYTGTVGAATQALDDAVGVLQTGMVPYTAAAGASTTIRGGDGGGLEAGGDVVIEGGTNDTLASGRAIVRGGGGSVGADAVVEGGDGAVAGEHGDVILRPGVSDGPATGVTRVVRGHLIIGAGDLTISNGMMYGTASNSTHLGGVAAADYAQSAALGDLATLDDIPLALVTNAGTMAAETAADYVQTNHTGNVVVNGFVGIGTKNPLVKLHIAGSALVATNLYLGSTNSWLFTDGTNLYFRNVNDVTNALTTN
jgi:hypothetical protein